MASDASDVQVCLCKLLKLSSSTCVTLALKYPYHSLSSLCLFLLYMIFPLVFWVLVYSFPPFVCVTIVVSVLLRRRNGKNEEAKKEEKCSDQRRAMFAADNNSSRRSFNRVHSVRQRRAKDIAMGGNAFQDKNAVSSTNIINDILVDKNALKEESPKEIREVEVQHYSPGPPRESSFPSPDPQKPLKNDDDLALKSTFQRLKALDQLNEEGEEEDEGDSRDTKNDVGIPDTYQRNKRLESLIARRRSRKIMDSEVRRTMMKIDKSNSSSDHGQIASLIIPKNNAYNSFPSGGAFCGPYSPGPDSAPSVLIPMRNPFDLPYDPQEEKPDLRDHSFKQEFMSSSASNHNNRDMMFCRHESFSLGGSMNHNREEASLVHAPFGLRQRDSSNKEFDREFPPTIEQQPHKEPSSSDNNPHDQIKEIIQVHENGRDHMNHGNADKSDDGPRVQTAPGASNSAAFNSSSDEDEPIYNKIDKEAILKSLSSMARRNYFHEVEGNNNGNIMNNDQIDDNLNAWYADRAMRNCHHPSYSIASDMQVELSEVSSQDISSWDSDPDLSNNATESRPALDNQAFRMHDSKEHGTSSADIGESSNASKTPRRETTSTEPQSIIRSAADHSQEMVQSSTNRARNGPQPTPNSSDPQTLQTPMRNEGLEQIPVAQSSYLSPKSVLHPTFSLDQLSSYDRDPDEDFQQVNTQTAQVPSPRELQITSAEQPTIQNFDADVGILQESPEPSSSSAINKQEIHENGTKPGDVASSSSSYNNQEVSNENSLPEQKQKSSEPSSVSASKPVNAQNIHENETKARDVAGTGSSQMLASPEALSEQLKPTQGTSSINNDNDSRERASSSTDEKKTSEVSSSSTSSTQAINNHKMEENRTKPGEVASSSSQVEVTREAPTELLLKPLEETNSSSSNDDNKVSNKNSSLSIDQKDYRGWRSPFCEQKVVLSLIRQDSSLPSTLSINKHISDQKIQENGTKNSEMLLPEETNNIDKESSKDKQESSEPSSVSHSKPVNEQTNHENETKSGEITSPAELIKPTGETNRSTSITNDKDSSEKTSSTNDKDSYERATSGSEAVNEQKIHDNETKQGEVSSGNGEAPTKLLTPTEETSTSSSNNHSKVPTETSSVSTNQKQESPEPSNVVATEAVIKQKVDGNETKQGEFANGSSSINGDKVSSEKSSPSIDQKQESSIAKQKIHENGTKPGEVDSGSSKISREEHPKTTPETSTGSSNGNIDKVSSDQKEPFVHSKTCTNEEKIHENGAKSGEEKPAEPLKTIEETSTSSFNNNDANSSQKSSQSTDQEVPAKRHDKVAVEAIPNDGTKPTKEGDQRELNSNLHKDTGHQHCSDKPTNNQETVLVEDIEKKNQHDVKGKEDGENK